ncbi:MAG: YggS family pyridoxal phosphate-dependent enzyme [Candidatus Dormibacteria bacterium]
MAAVEARIGMACRRAGRAPEDVELLAASKYTDAAGIVELAACGQRVFGENRVQDSEAKVAELPHQVRKAVRLHMIGHLQTNKARRAAQVFDVVQSVDSLRVAAELARGAESRGTPLPVLVQVNVAADPAKDGMPTEQLLRDAATLLAYDSLEIQGLMTIGALVEGAETARPTFVELRAVRDRLSGEWPRAALRHLSMGMSADFEVAIEEGATIVRVGTALFGDHHRPRADG